MRKLIALGAAALGGTAVVASKRTSILRDKATSIGQGALGLGSGARERVAGARSTRSRKPLLMELGRLTYDLHTGELNGEADELIAGVIGDLDALDVPTVDDKEDPEAENAEVLTNA